MIIEENIIRLNFSDLILDTSEFGVLLGYTNEQIPQQVQMTLNNILHEAPSYLDIKGGYVIKDIKNLDVKNGVLEIMEASFTPGKTICLNLRNSDKLVCFLCTAGERITKWALETMSVDPLQFYMIDLLGSLVVDAALDIIQSRIEMDFVNKGLKITNRYSPGHCGWKLTEQKELFSVFPENFCHVTLTSSSLMIPLKSVSGVFGVGKNAEKRDYSCQICDREDCIYRTLKKNREA